MVAHHDKQEGAGDPRARRESLGRAIMSDHPDAARLEELAAGGSDAQAEAHLAGCAVCRTFVAHLRNEARMAPDDSADFMAKVTARAEVSPVQPVARPVTRIAMRVVAIAAPLAAAAMIALLARPAHHDAPEAPSATSRFKGGIGLAVVRERSGVQERVAGAVRVRPGDRVRIEVSLDQEQPIVAGILDADGTWAPLLVPTTLEAGTHFSDQAARFDARFTEGWVIAGPPDDVARARTTRDLHGVTVVPVQREE
jgi:hypothetical protein